MGLILLKRNLGGRRNLFKLISLLRGDTQSKASRARLVIGMPHIYTFARLVLTVHVLDDRYGDRPMTLSERLQQSTLANTETGDGSSLDPQPQKGVYCSLYELSNAHCTSAKSIQE